MNGKVRIGRGAPAVALAGALVMVAMLAYGFANGYLFDQGYAIASIAWGQVLLADIYVGLVLIAAWIAWRESGRVALAAAWIVALLLLGNVVACVYVLIAWYRSGGDAAAFWYGRHA